jgi:hypothetical protein
MTRLSGVAGFVERVREQIPDGATALDREVACRIARYANADGEAWPGVETIMRDLGRSRRGVQTSLRRLEALGVFRVELGGGTRTLEDRRQVGRSSVYVFRIGGPRGGSTAQGVRGSGGDGSTAQGVRGSDDGRVPAEPVPRLGNREPLPRRARAVAAEATAQGVRPKSLRTTSRPLSEVTTDYGARDARYVPGDRFTNDPDEGYGEVLEAPPMDDLRAALVAGASVVLEAPAERERVKLPHVHDALRGVPRGTGRRRITADERAALPLEVPDRPARTAPDRADSPDDEAPAVPGALASGRVVDNSEPEVPAPVVPSDE